MNRRELVRIGVVLAIMAVGGCGYGLVGRTSNLPEDVQDIYIAPLENRTTRLQVDQLLGDAISQEFLGRQRFRIVNSVDEADAVLSGTVRSFSARPVTFTRDEGRGQTYQVLITAAMSFTRTDNNEVLWQQDHYYFSQDYEFESDETAFVDREDSALIDVASEFAKTLVIDVLEGF